MPFPSPATCKNQLRTDIYYLLAYTTTLPCHTSTDPAPPARLASVPTLQVLPQRTSSNQTLLTQLPHPLALFRSTLSSHTSPSSSGNRSPLPEDQRESLANAAHPAPIHIADLYAPNMFLARGHLKQYHRPGSV